MPHNGFHFFVAPLHGSVPDADERPDDRHINEFIKEVLSMCDCCESWYMKKMRTTKIHMHRKVTGLNRILKRCASSKCFGTCQALIFYYIFVADGLLLIKTHAVYIGRCSPTRLETRTKDSNAYASLRAV